MHSRSGSVWTRCLDPFPLATMPLEAYVSCIMDLCRLMALRSSLVALLALEAATAFMPAPAAVSPVHRSSTARGRDLKVCQQRVRDDSRIDTGPDPRHVWDVLLQLSSEAFEGMHGTGSRFLSLTQLRVDDYMPRIVQIAGKSCLLTSIPSLLPFPYSILYSRAVLAGVNRDYTND